MWMATILQILALGAVDPAAPLAASAAPAPIYWRQSLFSIPFHIDRPDQATQEAVEVQLYVSADKGCVGIIGGRHRRNRDISSSGRALMANTGSMSARSTVPARSGRKARIRPS